MVIAGGARVRADGGPGRAERDAPLGGPRASGSTRTAPRQVCATSASGSRSCSRTASCSARVLVWAALNWLLDAASLWVFLRAFGASLDDRRADRRLRPRQRARRDPAHAGWARLSSTAVYVAMLVGFGSPRRQAALGVASRTASPSSSSRSCSAASCTVACASGRGASSARSAAAPARHRRRGDCTASETTLEFVRCSFGHSRDTADDPPRARSTNRDDDQ